MFKLFPFRTRNWRSFNLRALLVTVTLAAIAFGALSQYYLPFQRQRAAIAALNGQYNNVARRTGGPAWMCRLFGEEHFQNVVELHLEYQKISDDDLQFVAQLPHLEKLYLARTSITDKGLAHLRGLPKLRRMSLYETKITPAGFKHLATCPEIAEIDAHDVPVTDEGLAALAKMSKLSWFVAPPALTEESLLKFAASPKASCIYYEQPYRLVCERLTDASVTALLQTNMTTRIHFVGCKFSEDSWRKITESKRFQILECGNTPIPEAIVSDLFDALPKNTQMLDFDSDSLPFAAVLRVLEKHPFARGDISAHQMFLYTRSGQMMPCCCFRLRSDLSQADRGELLDRVQFESLKLDGPLAKSLWEEPADASASLPSLARQEKLQTLTIEGVSDAKAIRMACEAKNLRTLQFVQVAPTVSADDLQLISELAELTELHLPHGNLRAGHFEFLAKLPKLKKLNLTGNRLDAGALEIVSALPELEVLYADYCADGSLTDEAIQPLRNCRKLRELHCRHAAITEASVPLFKEIESLRHLDLEGTKIPQREQVELQQALRSRFVLDVDPFFGS